MRRLLNTTLGDALAALPLEARESAAYRALCDGALAFATATLRHRLDDAASVRLLRRFLAALLPPDVNDDGSGAQFPGVKRRIDMYCSVRKRLHTKIVLFQCP